MECDFTQIENNFRDYIMNTLAPNEEHDYSREIRFKSIKKIIQNGFAAEQGIIPHIFSFGSFPLRTYLPDSDMDITVILEDRNTNKIISNLSYEYLNKILFLIKASLEKYNQEIGYQQIQDINIILADIKLIKCKFDSLSFDISINNFVGLCKLIFIHHIERKSFDRILFKRSLFLIKSWCYYEGSVLGSNVGLLASYALEILIIYMFNNFHHMFTNEIGALLTFFKMMNEIDWDKSIITIFGSLNIDSFYEKLKIYDFNLDSLLKEMLENKSSVIDFESSVNFAKTFEKFADMDKIQNFFSNKKAITTKYINIIDPMFQTNNLGKSVNFNSYSKIKKVFEYVNDQAEKIQSERSSGRLTPYEYLNYLLNLFNRTIIGMNHDLFSMQLSFPKIIIRPIENLFKDNKQKEDGKHHDDSDNEKEVITNQCNELSQIIDRFNNYFKLNNGRYPLENTISSTSSNNSNQFNYDLELDTYDNLVTHDIVEFFLDENDSNTYDFQSSLDINIIENFINNCN